MELANKRLNAVNSHFMAERDRCIAELDSLLNSNAIPMNMEGLVKVFERLAITNVALDNIRSIVSDNVQGQTSESGIRHFDMSSIDQMNQMLEAIREKTGTQTNDSESTKQE